ncbi:Putative gustatory receptor 28b [Trachymyrmex cornetzi]|uniref:Gustatory receptor n=1 Tax=Trachymyrmex cornetzi TaxID=471704 RepID=A0A195DQV1_9HYME|nr:Putative gustatory receptor 28b [Trachymyrmex cornetzi]
MEQRNFKQFFHDTSLIFSPSKVQERVKDRKEGRRWRLFHATDFQSLMHPCFIFCRVLGIFPYRINASSYEISKPCQILWTVIMSVVCFCTLMTVYVINHSRWFETTSLRRSIDLYAFYIFSGFIAVATYVWDGPRMRLFQTILKISSELPLETYQKQSMLIHAKDIIGFLFLLLQGSTSLFYLEYPILLKMFSIYITMLVLQIDMLYMNCICVLKACFEKINDSLANLLVMNNKSRLFRCNYQEQKNFFLLMELKALEKQHLLVNDAVQMLNMIFSLHLVGTIITTFVRITFFLYYCIILWQDILNFQLTSSQKLFCYIFFIASIMFYLMKTALIVWACETGKDQAIKIGITIHDVLNSTNDKQIKDELQLFSLQILHTTRRNTFCAKGLTVGAPLFAALIGNIISYLLILIQFTKISIFCK